MNIRIIFPVLIFISSLAAFGQPKTIPNYSELAKIIQSGNNVRVIIDYAKCKLIRDGKEDASPHVVGGMNINAFELFSKGSVGNEKAFLVFSESVLITHPGYGTVYNYVKFKVFEDDVVEITARYIDPVSYKAVMEETFYGNMHNAVKDGAVSFFFNEYQQKEL